MDLVHATCVVIDAEAVLLLGAPGSGKSDLALRLIDGGARLVADDQVVLRAVRGRLEASPPPALRGLLEVRGVGPLRLPAARCAAAAPLCLALDLVAAADVERLPEPARFVHRGVAVPRWRLDPFAASAAARVRVLLAAGPAAAQPALRRSA